MALIEFLFDHWYLLVVLFFLLSRFMGKSVREASKGQNRMPSFGGESPSQPKGITTEPRPMNEQRMPSQPANMIPDRPGRESPFSAAAQPQMETVSPEAFVYDMQPESLRPALDKELAQGIIWSEILGPPRAKKPYRR